MKQGKRLRRELFAALITVVLGYIWFYITLPALNLQSVEFYTFACVLLAIWFFVRLPAVANLAAEQGMQGRSKKIYTFFPLGIAAVLLALLAVFSVASLEIFNASRYKNLLPVETGDFASEIQQITYDQIPMLDKDSAIKLGNRKMGELADMVSQFEVSEDYVQINYKSKPVRITELQYAGFFKWLTNRKSGLPGYVMIDMVNQNTQLVRLKEGMKYSTSEYFGRNISRYVRFRYPTALLGKPGLEIDDDGVPYWITPKLIKRIGMLGGTDVQGAIFVNAITGEHQYYPLDQVPEWADHIVPAELIIHQYDYFGAYQRGFFNSLFGQKGVTQTTEGYNYIAQNDDVYVYTGVTSVNSDQSNIGFILVNQRTKDAKFYSSSGATEYSAMDSAEGAVADLRYTATFPILLNISGQPTYFMALKDSAQLVKMYAMVNVSKYQKVATGQTVAECEKKYNKLMQTDSDYSPAEGDTVSGNIEDIRTAVQEGYTWYYIKLIGNENYFMQSVQQDPALVTLNKGDSVKVKFSGIPVDNTVSATSITRG